MTAIVFLESADSSLADCLRFSPIENESQDCEKLSRILRFRNLFFFSCLKCVLSLHRSYDVRDTCMPEMPFSVSGKMLFERFLRKSC